MYSNRRKKNGRLIGHKESGESSVEVVDDVFLVGTDRSQCHWRICTCIFYQNHRKAMFFLLFFIVYSLFIAAYFTLDQSSAKKKMTEAESITMKTNISKSARYQVYQGKIASASLIEDTNKSSGIFEQQTINGSAIVEYLPPCPNGMNIPGVSIHEAILDKMHTFVSGAWGNVLSPYWAARVMADLGGYNYQGSVFGHGTWMEYLPTMVSRHSPRPELYNHVCGTCNQWEFYHECHYGWGYIQKTIFHDTRNAIESYVQNKNETELMNLFVTNQFQATDWLIYDRCCIFCHGLHGISDIYAYDNIPTEGTFTVYTLSPPYDDRDEGNGMCQPALHKLRDVYIKWRNPNITIVPLLNHELWVDWARLVYAPNLFLPSLGTSFGLWAALANVKVITGPPMKDILLDSLPDTFHIYSSPVIFCSEAEDFFEMAMDMKLPIVRSRVLQWWMNDVSFDAIEIALDEVLRDLNISRALFDSLKPSNTRTSDLE